MDFHVSLEGRGDLSDRIYRGIFEAILEGRLRRGERLPATRELAARLDVSRNTVAVAYDRLVAEGCLTARVGAGTFVADGASGVGAPARPGRRGSLRPRPIWASVPAFGGRTEPAPRFDFSVGVPDARLFPLVEWRQSVARALRGDALGATYADPAGHPALRSAIARHFGVSRHLRAAATDVVVTGGSQQAMDLVGRVLLEPGDVVAVEEPGYPPVRQLVRSLGARVVGVPVDDEGLIVEALPARARLVYVTPSHQFPLGVRMSLARRTALLAWADAHDAAIVEDDYDSEFRYEDRPLEPIQSLDRNGRVVYIGSFSKTMLPTLRLGFLVAPASLRPALLKARRLSDWHTELPSQIALARFIGEGLLARHVRRATTRYAARRARILSILGRDFAGMLEVVRSVAGLHVTARVPAGVQIDVEGVVARARASGVAVEALARYCAETPSSPGLVIGYGAIALDDVDEGLRILRACLDRVRSDAPPAVRADPNARIGPWRP